MPSDASRDADAEEINNRRSERNWGGCKGAKHASSRARFLRV